MIKKNDELFHEFYAKEGHKFTEANVEQCKEAAFAPWSFLKKEMENGELETVRFKYFGTFQVYPGRAKRMLANLIQRAKFNKIDQKQFLKLKEMLTKFLKKLEDG